MKTRSLEKIVANVDRRLSALAENEATDTKQLDDDLEAKIEKMKPSSEVNAAALKKHAAKSRAKHPPK